MAARPSWSAAQQLAIAESDADGLLQACQDQAIDLVVVGPEAPWRRAWPTGCGPPA
jgi:phosphoribosylamine-glycine ligase